ncbi:MAG: RidA family protein [Gemmatimonadales bacterium]
MRRSEWSGLMVVAVGSLLLGCTATGPGGGGGGPSGFRGPEPERARYINPGTLAALDGFTHAVRVGPNVYVSGQVALDSTGRSVGAGDLRAQAAQAFANLATVLRIAGATPAHVTKLTIYVVNYRPGDFDRIREAAPEFFPQRNPPAGVVVGVQSLPLEGLLLAVDANAFVPALFLPRRDLVSPDRRDAAPER